MKKQQEPEYKRGLYSIQYWRPSSKYSPTEEDKKHKSQRATLAEAARLIFEATGAKK